MYSQNNEEQVILNFFKGKIGTFLDLGSYTGVELSNVRRLAELGWPGVMVEASPTVFETLKKNYQEFDKVSLHNIAVGAQTGLFEFYDNHNAVGTLHPSETKRWNGTEQFEKIEVPCIEINEFLGQLPIKTFDFISCDVEGEDLNIIKRMDFNRLRTRLICVEWNGKDKHLYDKVLLPFKFRLIHRNAENLIYCRNY